MDWTNNCCMQNYYTLQITIAAAIHVIKCKPPEFATSKDYALHLKRVFFSNIKSKEAIFETEKETLINDLLSISEINIQLPMDTQSESHQNNGQLNDEEHIDENTNEDARKVEPNLRFIEALVHIKNATNSKDCIPLGKFQAFLSLVSKNVRENSKRRNDKCKEKLSLDTYRGLLCSKDTDPTDCFQSLFAKFSLSSPEMCQQRLTCQSQDSGYTSLEQAQHTSQNSYVLSSDVNQVIRKHKTDLILTKSVQVVLHSLTRIIDSKTFDEDCWRSGSTLETSVKSLINLVDCVSKIDERNSFRDTCSTFVKSLIEAIPSVVDNKCCSLRCTVIRELSASPYICKDSVSWALRQISTMKESICSKINSVGEDHFEMFSLDMVEEDSLFILYKLLKELLFLYVRRKIKCPPLRKTKTSKPLNMCALWKGNAVEDDADIAERSMLSEWKARLEELNEFFGKKLTNILFLNFECLSLLEEHITSTKALGKR